MDGISYKDGKIDYKESVKIAKGQVHSRKRGLVAEYMKHDSASKETEFFRVELDKLKEREILEDIQMRLNTLDENGYYPAMTEKDLQDLNTAYQKVSDKRTFITKISGKIC